jgi:hypothetical protein
VLASALERCRGWSASAEVTVLLALTGSVVGCASDDTDNEAGSPSAVPTVSSAPTSPEAPAVTTAAAAATAVTTAATVTTATTATTVTAAPAGPSRDEVAEVLYGTATCLDDPACSIVTGTALVGDILQIETGLFRDSDAEIPGLSACNAVAAQLWAGPVQVLGTDGGVIASGHRDQVPLCEVRL